MRGYKRRKKAIRDEKKRIKDRLEVGNRLSGEDFKAWRGRYYSVSSVDGGQ